jgi:hypothetical protein
VLPAADQEEHMLTLERAQAPSPVRPGVALVPLRGDVWRVTKPDGEVLGYVEQFCAAQGLRFRAKRFLARQRRFLIDGEFWSMADALECLRTD